MVNKGVSAIHFILFDFFLKKIQVSYCEGTISKFFHTDSG